MALTPGIPAAARFSDMATEHETPTTTVENCGKCGEVCASIHGTAACESEKCTIKCAQGYADCDGKARNGCEINIERNQRHCGKCLHDCEEGECEYGHCQPAVLDDSGSVSRIAIGGDSVFWAKNKEIRSCKLSGCKEGWTLFATSPAGIHDVTADDAEVYWIILTGPGGPIKEEVFSCPTSACPASGPRAVAASKQQYGRTVALNSKNVFWRDYDGYDIWQSPRSGGSTPLQIASNQSHSDTLVADENYVYWVGKQNASGHPISRCKVGTNCGSSSATVLATEALMIKQMALHDGKLYWTILDNSKNPASGAIKMCEVVNCTQPKTLVDNIESAGAFTVNASGVFWATESNSFNKGYVNMCLTAECKNWQQIAKNQQRPMMEIVADAKRTFWISQGKVIKLVRPYMLLAQ